MPSDSLDRIAGLKISGEINASDLRLLRQLSGCDDEMNLSRGTLRSLDLSEASIVGGGGYFLKVGNRQITTSAKRIPEMAFYGCRSLKQLILPLNDIFGSNVTDLLFSKIRNDLCVDNGF